ncbi:GTPase Obg-like [Sycon ciliatum]|uniref:GTPase Obg-like n=1 Tax=Sycon ciliatum TaxID=27933 RepID=UPI0031F6DE1A|eukprot:scpid9908/ scgid12890/ GTPase obg; GTP-binding protein obg
MSHEFYLLKSVFEKFENYVHSDICGLVLLLLQTVTGMIKGQGVKRCCVLLRGEYKADHLPPVFRQFVRHDKGFYAPGRKTFIDYKRVNFTGGNGGDGCASLHRAANLPKLGPDGADGGVGGSVILRTNHNIKCLKGLMPQYKADRGTAGSSGRATGRQGKDVVVEVPVGTIVRDTKTKDVLCDLVYDEQEFFIARGGHAGVGNMHFKNSVYQAPRESIQGGAGEKVFAELEMKCIADVGLVGFPNAGKSSFLRAVSKARPKVAAYPFTTLHPHIGMVEFPDEELMSIPVADIPGLIEGAHENKGLGHSFLKHIERCSSLLYVIDTSMGLEFAKTQYDKLVFELEMYKEGLSKHPSAVIASKMDISEDLGRTLRCLREHTNLPVECCSSVTDQRIEDVKLFLRQFQRKVQKAPAAKAPPPGTILNMEGKPSLLNLFRNFPKVPERPKNE